MTERDGSVRALADPRKRTRERARRFHWTDTALVRAGVATLPYLYEAYRALIDRTSRHSEVRIQELWDIVDREGKFLGAVLHEDVFHAAEMARRRGCVTMASFGGAGTMISRFLERADFIAFRGGSSAGRRNRGGRDAARAIADYLRNAPSGVPVGVTVDGSRGPARVVKPGLIEIARETGAPLIVFKTYARRNLRLPTWDRSFIPLPFNHILTIMDGPFRIAADADEAEVERVRGQVERALVELADEAMRFFDQDPEAINGR